VLIRVRAGPVRIAELFVASLRLLRREQELDLRVRARAHDAERSRIGDPHAHVGHRLAGFVDDASLERKRRTAEPHDD
jgi:hypothetical protein